MSPEQRSNWFRWWSIPLGLLLGFVAVFLLVNAGTKSGQPDFIKETQHPALTVIPAATSTKYVYEGSLPTVTPTKLFSAAEGIGIGIYVQISGTEGQGLRLRTEPGVNSKIRFLGYESEVFKVVEGPTDADSYTWWKLEAPYDSTRTGWAAATFLQVIDLQETTATP